MKKLIYIVIFCNSFALYAAENYLDSINNSTYFYTDSFYSIVRCFGMTISQFSTGSGFSSGTEAAMYVKGKNKSMELGAYFDNEERILTGLTMNYKLFILKNYFDKQGVIEPYLFYTFLYRITTYDKPLTMYPDRLKFLANDGKTRYSSIEHNLGAGLEINLLNYMYINCCVGFGRYLGSIKKAVCYDKQYGLYAGSDGWEGFYKIGLGVRIP